MKISLLFFSSLLLSLVIAEFGLRLYGFEYQLFPAQVEFGWPDPVLMEKEFEVDAELLWLPKKYDEKMADLIGTRPSIVYMGDSCTAWGAYDKALKQIFIDRHPQGSFSFINTGVGGWSSFQGLRQLQRDIVRIHPRVITIYYGWNDHWASFGIEDKNVARFNAANPWSVSLSNLRITQLLNFFTISTYGAPEEARRPKRVSQEDFRTNLTDMVVIAREHDIKPVLLTAPTSHTQGSEPEYLASRWLNSLDNLVPLHKQYVDIVRQVASDNNVLLLDLFDIFSRLPPRNVKDIYFVADGIHLTSEGSQVVAHLLYNFLRTKGLIDLVITPPG